MVGGSKAHPETEKHRVEEGGALEGPMASVKLGGGQGRSWED